MREALARLIVWGMVSRLLSDPHPLNRLLGRAAQMQLRKKPAEKFREDLEDFYSKLVSETCMQDIDFPSKVRKLDSPNGYKTDVLALLGDSSSDPHRGRFDFWARRFGLFRHLGVRQDVLILRAGAQVPPHGHSRVVSGFYVLQGKVAIRHYDRLQKFDGGTYLRKVLDTTLVPGGFTTNSEKYHNVHWLAGIAPVSYLFRFTAENVPGSPGDEPELSHSRVYLDPTAPPDASGVIRALDISADAAHQLRYFSSETPDAQPEPASHGGTTAQ